MLKSSRRAATLAALALPPTLILAAPALVLAPGLVPAAHAQAADAGDTAFVRSLASRMLAVVNGPGSAATKKSAIVPVLNQDVDVDAIGRFCLGRYWNVATPSQQQQFLSLFRKVLTNTITSKLGDYRGVGITVNDGTEQDGKGMVPTVITRPGQPPANVIWVISHETGSPKIVDVQAEGVSLSLTQRQDYASYLARHGNKVDALITALRNQVARYDM